MFQVGDRVILNGHWEFEDGIVGTIDNPPAGFVELTGNWNSCRRVVKGRRGPITCYYVRFDVPHDDGSGDGPYWGAEIDEGSLAALTRRAADDESE
jgi:hypothetical protein